MSFTNRNFALWASLVSGHSNSGLIKSMQINSEFVEMGELFGLKLAVIRLLN